jgi:hypothetical protein
MLNFKKKKSIKKFFKYIADSYSAFTVSTEIVKSTKFQAIVTAMKQNTPELFGITTGSHTNRGAELVSHFYGMAKATPLNEIYMPISDKVLRLSYKSYKGKLYDGLYYNPSLDSIVKKVEYKSTLIGNFNYRKLERLEEFYSNLGVDEVQLAHLNNVKSFERTLEAINSFDSDIVEFTAVDWSNIFNEPADAEFLDYVNLIIYNRTLATPALKDI